MKQFVERRRHPRAVIDYRGVLETAAGEQVKLRARNISASGIYFDAERRLAEFTEVSLIVALPAAGGEPLEFSCAGVIVRVEENGPDASWPFSAAVHFTDIEDGNRQAISSYVASVGD